MQELKRLVNKYSSRLKQGKGEPDFFYLMRLIENLRSDLPRLGEAKGPENEAVRLGQMPYLRFPETSLAVIEDDHTHQNEELLLLVYFFGLLGVNGPMPLDITDYVRKRTFHDYDSATRRFLDIINHRFLTLFYKAFSENEMAVAFDRENSKLEKLMMLLTCSSKREKSSLPHFTIKSMVNFLSLKNRSADGLRHVLHNFFGEKIELKSFVEKSYVIPQEYRLRLVKSKDLRLGVNTQLGSNYLSKSKSFAITIGPISFDKSFDFMPGRKLYLQLVEIVQLYLDRPLGFDIYLKIEAPSIKMLNLNGKFALGQSCHLISKIGNEEYRLVKVGSISPA